MNSVVRKCFMKSAEDTCTRSHVRRKANACTIRLMLITYSRLVITVVNFGQPLVDIFYGCQPCFESGVSRGSTPQLLHHQAVDETVFILV